MRLRRLAKMTAGILSLGIALAAAGCSESSTTASANDDEPKAVTTQVEYDGPEAELPTEFPAPEKQGEAVKIGVICAVCQVPGVALMTDEVTKTVEDLGGEVIETDAGGDPQKQLNQFRQLMAQGVQAIVIQPLLETAMEPAFEEAEGEGISVITIGAPGDTTQPLLAGVTSNVTFGLDKSAFDKAQYLASTLPEGAQIGVIGFGVPSDSVKYGVDRTVYWAEQFGLEVAQQTDVTELTVAAGQTAATALLQRNPEIRAIVSFTDAISSGVVTAARLLNRQDVAACANDFDKNGYSVVSSQEGSCSVRWDWENLGSFAATAAYEAATGQDGLPEVVTTEGGQLVTTDNVDDVPVVG